LKKQRTLLSIVLTVFMVLLNGCDAEDAINHEDPHIPSNEQINFEPENNAQDDDMDNNYPIDIGQIYSGGNGLTYIIEPLSDDTTDEYTGHIMHSAYLGSGRFEVILHSETSTHDILLYDVDGNVVREIKGEDGIYITNAFVDKANNQIVLAITDSSLGGSLMALDFEGKEIFKNHITEGYIHLISQNSYGNYVVVHSYINLIHDDGLQGLFIGTYDITGKVVETIAYLTKSDIAKREDELNPGLLRADLTYDVLGVVNNKVYFITSTNEVNEMEYRSYISIVSLEDETRTKVLINDALEINDIWPNRHSFYINDDDLKIVFLANTREFESEVENIDVRIVVYDITQDSLLATYPIEELSRSSHIVPMGDYSFMFMLPNGKEPAYMYDLYKLTLVFE